MNEQPIKPTKDLFCPECNTSIGVYGVRTETFSQFTTWCKACGCEFTVNYFKKTGYNTPLYRAAIPVTTR